VKVHITPQNTKATVAITTPNFAIAQGKMRTLVPIIFLTFQRMDRKKDVDKYDLVENPRLMFSG